jgi:hypothetical protein
VFSVAMDIYIYMYIEPANFNMGTVPQQQNRKKSLLLPLKRKCREHRR